MEKTQTKLPLAVLPLAVLLLTVLLLAVPSCIGPHSQESTESPRVYKRASFRTWQLFDSIDSRYTPFRLSRVTDIEASGESGWKSR